ncbi:hypothetical protein Patl1_03594 [Pistacia atlantica]|uniref:Uncharacterized protein n=1 Tax=Pistacia atlantica TaxID=434234 RepID=A0ACC1C4J8_9ROSI|nr:hypothetical protein Patl1_03594 [Pistacia atlantica]
MHDLMISLLLFLFGLSYLPLGYYVLDC